MNTEQASGPKVLPGCRPRKPRMDRSMPPSSTGLSRFESILNTKILPLTNFVALNTGSPGFSAVSALNSDWST